VPNKLTGELRLDLSQPVTANELGELLADMDEQGVERSNAIITLQPAMPHVGEFVRDPYANPPKPAGMQLVATWSV
jgi:hypothetical protein